MLRSVKIPEDLYLRLGALAKSHDRSVLAELRTIIRDATANIEVSKPESADLHGGIKARWSQSEFDATPEQVAHWRTLPKKEGPAPKISHVDKDGFSYPEGLLPKAERPANPLDTFDPDKLKDW